MLYWVRLKSNWVLSCSPEFVKLCKLITVKRLMFSCWSLFNTEAVFSFFELPLDLLAEVSVVFTSVCSISVSCKCFSFLFLLVAHLLSIFVYRYFWCLRFIIFLKEYSVVYCISWMGLVNEVFPACLGCCCGRFWRF